MNITWRFLILSPLPVVQGGLVSLACRTSMDRRSLAHGEYTSIPCPKREIEASSWLVEASRIDLGRISVIGNSSRLKHTDRKMG